MIETIHDLPDILTSVPHKEGISMNKKLLSLLLALTLVLGLAAAFADNGIATAVMFIPIWKRPPWSCMSIQTTARA